MAPAGKLSSYFSKRRPDRGREKGAKKSAHNDRTSVRECLETKLHFRDKTSFAFDFKVENDDDTGQPTSEGAHSVHKRRSFCFGFDPTSPGNACEPMARGASTPSGVHRSVAQALVLDSEKPSHSDVDADLPRPTPPKASKKRNKKRGKTKRKGKQRGAKQGTFEPAERRMSRDVDGRCTSSDAPSDNSPVEPQGIFDALSTMAVNKPRQRSCLPEVIEYPPLEDLSLHDLDLAPADLLSRPPPGLTLESWKDPALTSGERRRRRYGRGVRNLAAIHRKCDTRRDAPSGTGSGLSSDTSAGLTSCAEAGHHGPGVHGNDGAKNKPSGGSVFSFGFDIGASLNGDQDLP